MNSTVSTLLILASFIWGIGAIIQAFRKKITFVKLLGALGIGFVVLCIGAMIMPTDTTTNSAGSAKKTETVAQQPKQEKEITAQPKPSGNAPTNQAHGPDSPSHSEKPQTDTPAKANRPVANNDQSKIYTFDASPFQITEKAYYKGDVVEGNIPQGHGIVYCLKQETQEDGSVLDIPVYVYTGEFKNGMANGKGIMYPNTEIEVNGIFRDNEPILYPYVNEYYIKEKEGIVFNGEEGKAKGGRYVTTYYPHGNVFYEGEWNNQKITGNGTKYYDTIYKIKSFEGRFEDGRLMGKGKGYHENGQLAIDGSFAKSFFGQWGLHGKAIIYNEDGNKIFEGNFSYGDKDGRGVSYSDNGNIYYDGDFSKNKFNGRGRLYYKSGKLKYDGDFKNDLYDGRGRLLNEEGQVLQQGRFKNGKCIE